MTGDYLKYYRSQIKDLHDTNVFSINVGVLKDLLDTVEYANKAAYVLESMPVDLDDMLGDYNPDEDY